MKTPLLVFLTILLITSSAISGELSGEKFFKKKCKSCHSLTKKKMGPPLGDIWGKKAGSQKGYRYSKTMKKSDIVWNKYSLDEFLENPKKYIKGTKMKIRGLKAPQRDVVIEYLKENQTK